MLIKIGIFLAVCYGGFLGYKKYVVGRDGVGQMPFGRGGGSLFDGGKRF